VVAAEAIVAVLRPRSATEAKAATAATAMSRDRRRLPARGALTAGCVVDWVVVDDPSEFAVRIPDARRRELRK
jgi:hypothetical protein